MKVTLLRAYLRPAALAEDGTAPGRRKSGGGLLRVTPIVLYLVPYLVPTLLRRYGHPDAPRPVRVFCLSRRPQDAERPGWHYHAERGNEQKSISCLRSAQARASGRSASTISTFQLSPPAIDAERWQPAEGQSGSPLGVHGIKPGGYLREHSRRVRVFGPGSQGKAWP
jgi:hypothetical protein